MRNPFPRGTMKISVLIILLASVASQVGCVTGRREISLSVPQAASPSASARGTVAIASVTDARVFQNKPSDPSTPSVNGDATKLSDQEKSRMIGRQRNTYGKAMGDVALPEKETVEGVTRQLLEQGLKKRGYQIGADANAGLSANVTITDFWAWFSPGMWSIDFEARVQCTVVLRREGKAGTLVIKGHGINSGQFASDANWREAYERAFQDFLGKMDAELEKAGF